MWSVPVAAGVGVDLPLRSMWSPVLLVDQGVALSRVPPVFSDLALLQYSRPEGDGRLLLGNSDHADPQYADPDDYPNRAGEDYVATAIDKLVRRFPVLADGAVATSYAGCYDVTPDYNPVIGPAGPAGLVVAAGFSGHGFKISPAVGALVADLVCGTVGAVPGVDPAVFRLERFAEGRPLRSDHLYRGAGEMR
jgi:glycine/D-amino acid oxidase-like deaminating enzyme